MKYYWTRCPGCGCEVAINLTEGAGRAAGSLRRWSTDRSINDGRAVSLSPGERSAGGGFTLACVCGQALAFEGKPDAVGAEREEDLRVDLRKL